jgi:predicted Fe-Mo cluster-binding NifX family protein
MNQMLIALCINKPDVNSALSGFFGRSKYFLLYNTNSDDKEVLANPFASELGGAGILSAKLLISKSIDVIIIKNIGRNPLRVFNSANVKVYQSKTGTVKQALDLFKIKKLKYMADESEDYYGIKRRHRLRRMNNE